LATVTGIDCTGSALPGIPQALLTTQLAGYSTGSGGIAWSAAQWARYPGALRIDQTPAGGIWDALADYDDYENGAVQLGELAPRAKLRTHAWAAGTRPGQRKPAIYASQSNLTPVCNALIAGGVTSGVGLVVANWNLTEAEAIAKVNAGSGPFPIVGVQYQDAGAYDRDAWSAAWLADVSKPAGPYRHTADGKQTLDQIAAARHANVTNLLLRSIGNWTANDKTIIESLVLPAGFPYYTENG